MFIRALMLTTAIAFAGPALAQDNAAPTDVAAAPTAITDPAEFAAMASVSNLFEIDSSNLALQKSSRDDVQAFAEQMVADHTKAAEDMAPAASEEGISPVTGLDERHQQILDHLQGLEGEEFDAAYISAQVQAHDEAVALFEGYSTDGQDGPLKEFAASTLPTLQMHQEHVHELAGS